MSAPHHTHLEQHAALPREGQEVGHRVAHVLEEGCRDCRLCHTGHQLGEQKRSLRPQTHSQQGTKDWTTAHSHGTRHTLPPAPHLYDRAQVSLHIQPELSPQRAAGRLLYPAEDRVPTCLRSPATHKAVPSVQSPGHKVHRPWGDPHLSTKTSGAPYCRMTRGRTRTLSRVRRSSPRPDRQEQLYSMSEPRAGYFPQNLQRVPTP